jgi:hypothetical protein
MLTSLAELVVINLTLSYFSRLLFSVVDEFSADAFIFKLLEISLLLEPDLNTLRSIFKCNFWLLTP